jgi:hypothetical protein
MVGDAPGYDSGNPLLAVVPGTGVSLKVAGVDVPRAKLSSVILIASRR